MGKKGFPGMGGMPNMNAMMKQAQKVQQQMAEMKEELEKKEYETSAGGGAVTVRINGKRELVDIQIQPEAVDPDDVEMLQDLIIAAVNEAIRTADDTMTREMSKLTGGMNMPGM